MWCVIKVNTGMTHNSASFAVTTSQTFHFVPNFSGISRKLLLTIINNLIHLTMSPI